MSYEHPRTTRKNKSVSSPLTQLWSDGKYSQIPQTQIQYALGTFDNQVHIQNATTFLLMSLLAGGVLFARKSFDLLEDKAKLFSELSKRWAKHMWRYLFSLNFAAAIIDPDRTEGSHMPFVCLPLELLEIYVHRDYLGRLHFKYFKPSTPEDMRQEIKNVHTFIRSSSFLDMYGNIVSPVTVLIPEFSMLSFKKEQTMAADFARANPVLIFEEPIQKPDPNVVPHLPTTGLYLGDGNNPHINSTTTTKPIEPMGSNYSGSRIPGMPEIINGNMPAKRKDLKLHDNYSGIMELPPGKQLATGPNIEVPDNLLEVDTALMEKVYQSFGIPLSLISNAASTSGMRNASGNGGGKQASGNNNSNAKMIFQSYLQEMKNFTIGMIETMYAQFYGRHHYEQVKTAHKKKYEEKEEKQEYRGPSMEELIEECKVEVSIPGIPDEDTLTQLLTMGALKYSYFKSATALRYGIAPEAFNDNLQLTVQELNGFQEKPDEPPTKKSKS